MRVDTWGEIIHLAPHNIKKKGIRYKVYQEQQHDLIELVEDINKSLHITDEMDCMQVCFDANVDANFLSFALWENA